MKDFDLKKQEKKMILEALTYYNGNRTHSAAALNISVRTLRNKLTLYGKRGYLKKTQTKNNVK